MNEPQTYKEIQSVYTANYIIFKKKRNLKVHSFFFCQYILLFLKIIMNTAVKEHFAILF